ncbi:uncharacterized protein LOC116177469 [Photinus pyralis]|uniref:uncharacterized protein LOC116177469 n=1 Tax=Photinus pyralis TaxID=7054 RepID=UPI001266EC6C|nr:uncharacterized protein LOC116177469 [Photinus pyralis]
MEIESKVLEKDKTQQNLEETEEGECVFQSPLKKKEDLRVFEEKLKEKEFLGNILKVLSQNDVMDNSLAQKFSWKGQQRKDQVESKECFSKLLMCDLIYKCVKVIWPKENNLKKKIEATLSTFLAQQGSLYLKRSSITMEPSKEDIELE